MFYKVVRRSWIRHNNGDPCFGFTSYMAGNFPTVIYPVGEFATPKVNSGLLVFDSLEAAKNMITNRSAHIFECECEEEVPLPPVMIRSHHHADEEIVRRLWELNEFPYYRSMDFKKDHWPKGTRAFRKVKLTREVK